MTLGSPTVDGAQSFLGDAKHQARQESLQSFGEPDTFVWALVVCPAFQREDPVVMPSK